MRQPEGYEEKGKENLVCKLNKAIYGLKQSPRCWNTELHNFLVDIGFKQCVTDPCVYVNGGNIVAVYVDDLIILTNTESEMKKIKSELSEKFRMKDLGKLNQFLGVKVVQGGSFISLNQSAYIQEI